MSFAYTLGLTKSYDTDLASSEGCIKMGRRLSPRKYSGGWLFQTAEEAEDFRLHRMESVCPDWNAANFSVYEVEITSWEADAWGPHPTDGVHRLLNDSRVTRKVSV